jgi:hypothetical protein
VAILVYGLAGIALSTFPAPDEPRPLLAVLKVLLSTVAVLITGIAVFALGRRKAIHA